MGKELRESFYRLCLIKKVNLISDTDIEPILQEAKELNNIIGKSIVTAKKK